MDQGQERKGEFPWSNSSSKGRVLRNSLGPLERTCTQAAEAKWRLKDWWNKTKEGVRHRFHSYTGFCWNREASQVLLTGPLLNTKALQATERCRHHDNGRVTQKSWNWVIGCSGLFINIAEAIYPWRCRQLHLKLIALRAFIAISNSGSGTPSWFLIFRNFFSGCLWLIFLSAEWGIHRM